ncbi:MAG: hypothetical protein J6L05_01050 [Ruminococcus sp.]|nr:hypothetical protein [Ruminococcus sp.]
MIFKKIAASLAASLVLFTGVICEDKINSAVDIECVSISVTYADYDDSDCAYSDCNIACIDTYEMNNAALQTSSGSGSVVKQFVISLIIALIIAAIAVGSMVGQLKTVRKKQEASDYKKEGSFRLEESRDTFLYKKVNKVPRSNNNK